MGVFQKGLIFNDYDFVKLLYGDELGMHGFEYGFHNDLFNCHIVTTMQDVGSIFIIYYWYFLMMQYFLLIYSIPEKLKKST